jgi:hypothetical protein
MSKGRVYIMIKCPKCLENIEIQQKCCSFCGETINYTIAEKFEILAESVENALKKELETRKRRN